ncbi:MAG: hypothetical protein RLY31_67 [Bacteroidota bacterium]|jgi:type IX secretion system PorP/SprF family membrane protein
MKQFPLRTFRSGRLGVLVCTFLMSVSLLAQDPHFSQFYAAPMQLNPAMTGMHPGKWRVVSNYREQWNSLLDTRPFRTISTSFDYRQRVGRGDYVAFGLSALSDQAGKSEFHRTNGHLSLSYLKQLDGSRYRSYDQYLIGGVQTGIGQHTIVPQNLWFSSQFDLGTEQVDRSLPSGEQFRSATDLFLDINAGLVWYAVFSDNNSVYLGGAVHHVNGPNISFIDSGKEELPMKWVAHMGGEFPFNRQLSLLPAVAFIRQRNNMVSLAGANFRYTNRDWKEIAIRAGAWAQLAGDWEQDLANPAVTFTAILEVERWNMGVSYDVSANKLAEPTNGRGAVELSLIYYHPASRREKVNCPKL